MTPLELIQKAVDTMSVWADKINAGFTKTDSNESRLDNLEPTVSEHATDITNLETITSDNASDISHLQTTVGENSADIQNLQTGQTDHENRITYIEGTSLPNLDNDISEVSSRLDGVYPWGTWDTTLGYDEKNITRDGGGSYMAKTATTFDDDPPGPRPVGSPVFFGVHGNFEGTGQHGFEVRTGQRYTFKESGWITGVKVWVPSVSSSIELSLIIIDRTDASSPKTTVRPIYHAEESEWTTVLTDNIFVLEGSVLDVLLGAINKGQVLVDSEWYFWHESTNPSTTPSSGALTIDTDSPMIYVNKVDTYGGDQISGLTSLTAGDSVALYKEDDTSDIRYYTLESDPDTVNDVIRLDVSLDEEQGMLIGGQTVTLLGVLGGFPYVEYAFDDDYWSSNPSQYATCEGLKIEDGVEEVHSGILYGVDIGFQPSTGENPDWGLIGSYNGIGLSQSTTRRIVKPPTDDPKWERVTSDITHLKPANYLCDTTSGQITIIIAGGVKAPFSVFDSAKNFNADNLIIIAPDGTSITLHDNNRSWFVFQIDDSWYAVRKDRGELLEFS